MDERRQLRWLMVYAALTYPFVCVPFLYFHFRDHGVLVEQDHDMIAVYYAAMVLLEVPTGMLADRFGRAKALVVGPIVQAIGYAVLAFGHTFFAFCVGQVVLGLGHSIVSGPPSALLFETLARSGRQREFLRLESRVHAIRLLGTASAFLLGGFVVAWWGIEPAIWATIALHGLGSLAALRLVEAEKGPHGARTFAALVASGRRDLADPAVRWVAMYFVLLFFLLRYCFHTYQPFLEAARDENPLLIGGLYAAMNLFAAPWANIAGRAVARLGAFVVWLGMLAMLGVSLVAMAGAVSTLGIAMMVLHQVPLGMHWGLIQSLVNHRLGPAARATTLSVLSFLARLVFAALFPLVGRLHQAHGLPVAYLTVGGTGLVLGVLCMLRGRKYLGGVGI